MDAPTAAEFFENGLAMIKTALTQMAHDEDWDELQKAQQSAQELLQTIDEYQATQHSKGLPCLLDRTDIWVNQILPFLGIGHYAFVEFRSAK